MRIAIGAVLILVVMLVAGCTQNTTNNNANPNVTQTLYTPPEGNPSVEILSPGNGGLMEISSIGVKVNVTNFRLAGIVANKPNQQNEGHLHFYLDGGNEKMSSLEEATYVNIADGTHTITVELRNNDHSQLTPPVSASVTFTVKEKVQQGPVLP